MHRRDRNRYNGCRMGVYGSILPWSKRLAEVPVLSKAARPRLQWFKFYERHGHNASLTCRHFGLTRQTFYRWKARYDARGVKGLEDRPKRPRRVRGHTWSWELEQEVKRLREKYPRWGKDKLAVLPELKGRVSVSMVGRILRYLKATGRLKQPELRAVSARKGRKRLYAVRKPKEYVAKEPGDLIEYRREGRASVAGDSAQAFHRRGCGVALGRGGGPQTGDGHECDDGSGFGRGEDAVQGEGDAG
ncbi:MAG: helix-turn-helix domain-containing protein [Dehalococcoidales bacterium]|nr:helix-turn-helix domain-containing protein [Dehalococcoidales bacterium]